MIASKHIQGFFPLIMILAVLLFGIRILHKAKGDKLTELENRKVRQVEVDRSMKRLDTEIRQQSASLEQAEKFFQAWAPEIQKCQDSDALIAGILVEAYQLDLVPMKKEVHNDVQSTFRGRTGKLDRIELSVAGRYDRLVRFMNGLRKNYPFLRAEKIGFSVSDSSVLLSMVLSACKLKIPDTDLNEWLAKDGESDNNYTERTSGDA